MKFFIKNIKYLAPILIWVIALDAYAQKSYADQTYLNALKKELQLKWPKNNTINLVFHGHSVPSGYMKTPLVNRLGSYPFMTLEKIKEYYPHAVINAITTSIGGEHSEQGAKRFEEEVLNHKPDVLFIDYALNDRSIGLKRAKEAWEQMIKLALLHKTKLFLLTPTPDLTEDILDTNSKLGAHSRQIRKLAEIHKIGLIDSYARFQEIARNKSLAGYMAQKNHINEIGHMIVAQEIVKNFVPNKK